MVALKLGHGGIKFGSWWHWIDLMVGSIDVVVGWIDLMVRPIEVVVGWN